MHSHEITYYCIHCFKARALLVARLCTYVSNSAFELPLQHRPGLPNTHFHCSISLALIQTRQIDPRKYPIREYTRVYTGILPLLNLSIVVVVFVA